MFERNHIEPYTPEFTDSLYQEIKYLEETLKNSRESKEKAISKTIALNGIIDKLRRDKASLQTELDQVKNLIRPKVLDLLKQLSIEIKEG